MDHLRMGDDLATALGGLEPETRQALGRALERGAFELEGGEWGDLLEREGDIVRARRTARDLIGGMLHRTLADAPRADDVIAAREPVNAP